MKKKLDMNIRSSPKGMVQVESSSSPMGVMEFIAEFKLIKKDEPHTQKNFPASYQPQINGPSFRQCCSVVQTEENTYVDTIPKFTLEENTTQNIEQPNKNKIKQSTIEMMSKKGEEFNNQDLDELYDSIPTLAKFRSKSRDFLMNNVKPKKNNQEKKQLACGKFESIKNIRKNSGRMIITNSNIKLENFQLPILYSDKKKSIRLRFMYFPEYVTVGQKIMINDQRIQAVGTVTEIIKMEKY